MTSDEARESFSLAYDLQLSAAERRSFDEALERDAELAEEYAGFCATFAAISGEPSDDPATPNLLPSIQRRLRNASGGRYYGDRFAERSGVGRFQPWMLLLGLALLIAIVLVCVIASQATTP